MRGHGDSGWSAEGAHLAEAHPRGLTAFVEQPGLRNITLLGNPTRRPGGAGVRRAASAERVARLIVEDAGPERIVPPETQRWLKPTLTDVRIEIMPGLGHYTRTRKRRTDSSK